MARASNASQTKSPASASKKPSSSSSKRGRKPSSKSKATEPAAPKPKAARKKPAPASAQLFEFDKIQGYRYTVKPGEVFHPNKHVEFLTHWIGTDSKGQPWKPTWEPLANFDESPENLSDFLAKEKFLKTHLKL